MPAELDPASLPDDPKLLRELLLSLVGQLKERDEKIQKLTYWLNELKQRQFGRRSESQIDENQQLLSFRRFGSPVQGHPVPLPEIPWVDVATGSLGQGMPIGFGEALAMKLDGSPARVWVLMGDSEFVEGSIWEAMANASFHDVANLRHVMMC